MQMCLFFSFLKSLLPSNKQSGGMKAGCQRGKVTKPGEVSKIHCCLCPSGLGAWAQVESCHLAPGGHGPLSPSPVLTLAELVIFSQPQAILVSALFLPAPEPLWCSYWFSRKPPEEGGGRVGLGISLIVEVPFPSAASVWIRDWGWKER